MITDIIKRALANHIESSLIVKGYHWNIEGIEFNQYHSFFDEIYSEYDSQIDRLAEYIRIVSNSSEYVNASVEVLRINKTVKSVILVGNKPLDMVNEIITLNDALMLDYKEIFDSATKEKLEGLANYCADRLDVLKKLNWKLIAVSKGK